MSYLKKIEYEIVLKDSFSVIRNCPKCGRKTYFKNTKRFRVNANGNKLDVWLIYYCEKCKHTLNLAIYERQKASSVPEKEYQSFLSNDYQYVKLSEARETDAYGGRAVIIIRNPYGLKVRPEKQIAEILIMSRSQVKKMIEEEKIRVENTSLQVISVWIDWG